MDLSFLGIAYADNGLFDEPRCIFADFDPGACGDHDHDAAGLTELQRGLRILVDEHFFHRGGGRGVVIDQGFQLIRERRQAARQRRVRVGADLAVGDMGEPVALGLDEPPAGGAEPGVEAEDFQASLSSSSSGTS
jgi:hypothetical protein